jgi:hypothetical protein
MTPHIQDIADLTVRKRHLFSQHPVLTAAQTLRRNFTNIIGTATHCPRCLLRGEAVRWFPERDGQWQVYRCPESECEYEVRDR